MIRILILFALVASHICAAKVYAAEPIKLSKKSYQVDKGVLIMQLNWGRTWPCGRYQNAQLQALTFRKTPITAKKQDSIKLKTPSRLFVDDKYLPQAFVIEPGEYALTDFDVKIALSVKEVRHIRGGQDHLIKEGKPIGGSFKINAGEIVYIGHFGLDCGQEPFLWRFYLEDRKTFEGYVKGFRQAYPFLSEAPVTYRLFSTTVLGTPFELENSVVQ